MTRQALQKYRQPCFHITEHRLRKAKKPEQQEEEEKYVPPLDDFERPRLSDIAGNKAFKEKLELIVESMLRPQLYQLFGLEPDKTFLLSGPPGSGKTYAVRAMRNELAARGKNVLWAPYSIGQHGTAYINMNSVILQNFFDQTRSLINKGSYDIRFMFFDEAEVIMGKRGNERESKEDKKLLNTLMTNLQDINSHADNTYIFFATNFKDAMDSASLRAGRIDNQIEFPMPDLEARTDAYAKEIAHYNGKAGYQVLRGLEPCTLAMMSSDLTYADIHAIVEGGIRERLKQVLKERDDMLIPQVYVTERRLLEMIKDHRREHYKNNEYFGGEHREVGFKK